MSPGEEEFSDSFKVSKSYFYFILFYFHYFGVYLYFLVLQKASPTTASFQELNSQAQKLLS